MLSAFYGSAATENASLASLIALIRPCQTNNASSLSSDYSELPLIARIIRLAGIDAPDKKQP